MWWNVNETPALICVFMLNISILYAKDINLFVYNKTWTNCFNHVFNHVHDLWTVTLTYDELENATLRHPQARLFMFCNSKKMSPVLWCHRTNIRQSSNQYREASPKHTMRVYELAIFAPVSNWFHSVSLTQVREQVVR